MQNGMPLWWCAPALLAAQTADADTRAGIAAVAPQAPAGAVAACESERTLREMVGAERLQTLGGRGASDERAIIRAKPRLAVP